MSLLWIDGFEGYGSTPGAAPSPTNIMARRYVATGESSIDIVAGRISGYGVYFAGPTCELVTPVLNANATIIVGFGFKYDHFDNEVFLSLDDGGTTGINLELKAGGNITLNRGVTELGSTTGLALLPLNWYWIELKVLVDNTVGTYELRVGETNVLSDTGVDTQAGSNAYYDVVKLEAASNAQTSFDDFYVCNGAGGVQDDFLGNCHIIDLSPDGIGNISNFAPSAGNNFACMDELPITDDTDYVESATAAHKDTYTYEDMANTADIVGIQINTHCRETDATPFDLITVIRSAGADYDSAGDTIGTTDYITKRYISVTDPDTAVAWLWGGINAAEFGIKIG